MRTHSTLLAVIAVLAAAGPRAARADDDETTPSTDGGYDHTRIIGVDGAVVVPVGTWGDGAGIGVGAIGRLSIPLGRKLAITARLGLIYHLGKDVMGTDLQTTEVPVLGGVRYAFTPRIYGAGELGLVYLRSSASSGGSSMTGSDTKLGMALSAGYHSGKLDVRAGLHFPDAGEVGDAMGLFASVGWDVTSL